MSHYRILDRPHILRNTFFPRRGLSRCPEKAFDYQITVDDDVLLHCRFYTGNPASPSILYFHGNGEIASDYDNIAPLYNIIGANLVIAEFRGYGASSGSPTFMTMLEDAHHIYTAVREELARRNFSAELFIMGRSLGSVSAFELAASSDVKSKGLIIESGFVSASRIARRLGYLPEELEPLEAECRQKIQAIRLPALILHGEEDNIVPMTEAEAIYSLLPLEDKTLYIIPYADHNTMIFEGGDDYFGAIANFMQSSG